MTNYDNKKSKIFISLNVLLKEISNMMICAFFLSRRSYLCFKPICHQLLSQLTRIDWCRTLQIALQADQFPRRAQSLIPNFPLKVAHLNSELFIFSNFFYIKFFFFFFFFEKEDFIKHRNQEDRNREATNSRPLSQIHRVIMD